MRFVKINAGGRRSNSDGRNFIATSNKEIDRCEKTDIIKIDTTDEKSAVKRISGFSMKKAYTAIKNRVAGFCSGIDRKKATVAVAVLSALLVILIFNVNFTFAYSAFVDGVEVGFVPDKLYVDGCIGEINSEFSRYVSGQSIITDNVVCVPTVIRRGAYTDKVLLVENIKSTSPVMTRAYAVEVNGIAYTALSDMDTANRVLADVSSAYKQTETTQVYFSEDVQIVYEYVPMSILVDAESALTLLSGYTTLHHTVTVDAVVSANEFALNNGMDKEYFSYLNPHIGENINPGEEILVPQRKPVVTVMTCDTIDYEKSIPYEEEVTEDASMYEGTERIVQRGVEGVNVVTEEIIRANGQVVNQKVLHTQVVSEPVVQLMAVGTKPRPDYMGTGSFMRPYGGNISSRFGSRRTDYHSGIDICGNTGDPIEAADNGTVIFSGWSGGYGNIVKIDHGNGYTTYYAHCSELYVKEGDVVSKGDVVGAVGSTGNSTGPHLHFEVRYNGKPLDPMDYIN